MAALATVPMKTGLSLRERQTRRWAAMKTERGTWDSHIRDVFDHTRPRRTRFSQTQINKGDRRNQSIIDNTGVIAANVLLSGMVNGLSSPAQPWFKYEPNDLDLLDYGPVKDWIGQLERLVRRIFQASNVYEALPTIYSELILGATGCGVIEDDFEDVIRINTFTWGEYAIAANERRIVDTLYREMSMSALQVIGKFGLNNVSQTVRSMYDTSNYDAWIPVMHAIEPNLDRDADKIDASNMAFRSNYWERDGNEPDRWLRKSGYRDNPIIAPRWDVVGNDIYGSSSPGMNALGDMRQLQIQQKRKGEGIDKGLRPATQGPPSLQDRFVSTMPGQHTVVADSSTNGGVRPIFQVPLQGMQWLNDDILDTRTRVNEAFFKPWILAISSMEGVQPRNQMEISERKAEGLMVLGPVVQRLQNELHNPLHLRVLNRIYDVCTPLWKTGQQAMLPPPPPELQGRPIQVEYISSLAQMQKAAAGANIRNMLTMVAQLAQVFPDIVDKIDAQEAVDVLGDIDSLSPGVIRSDEAVAALAQQRQQAQQAQQMAAAMPALKDGADAAKSLGETQIGGDKTALETMLGNQDLPKPSATAPPPA